MVKTILVALDPDQDTPVATQYAADIAHRSGAEVSGLAVVDTRSIDAEVGPGDAVGGRYLTEGSRQRMLAKSRETARALTGNFDLALDQAQVEHGERLKEGDPVEHVLDGLKYSDLLVIGRVPHFFYNRPERKTNTLARIVKHSIAPSLVVGDRFKPVQQVLVAFDGSEPSARAMQRFAQLQPFGTDLLVEVVYVRSGESARQRGVSTLLLQRASRYLKAHGFEHIRYARLDGEQPAPLLVEHAMRMPADLIVAGAHAVSALRRIAFGSTTHELLQTCTVPLFLFH